jgi:paraquat-inducible protein B
MAKTVNQTVKSAASRWYIWLFPVFALAICGYLLNEYLKQQGPTIKILFDDASSIQAEKTKVRFRGVNIGSVKKITLSSDSKDVVVYVTLQKDAAQFAVEGSKFWVVAPKVDLTGISGLETLLGGTYITVLPGKPDGDFKDVFKGQEGADPNDSLEAMTHFTLDTPNLESITPGDAVTFRGLNVGSVSKVTLSKTAQMGVVQIQIQNRYTKLIRNNTVFWRKVGIQAKLGLFGADVKVNSIDSILHGGIEFFTPDPPAEIAKPHSKFDLSAAPPKGYEKWNPVLTW